MISIDVLPPRKKRILNEVLQELERAISAPDARLTLETNPTSHILLANPDLQPIAFAIRHVTWRTYIYGVLGEILAWTIFVTSGLFLMLAFAVVVVLAVVLVCTLYLRLAVQLVQRLPTLLDKLQRVEPRFRHMRWMAQRRRYNAYKRLCADRRAPILYLRSFSFDLVYELPLEDARRADERLAEYYEQYGPVIAVAGPDDKGPMLGPVRLHFDDDFWRVGVTYLMSVSQLVVIQAGISQGTLWELGMARQMLEPEKLIISAVDASDPNIADSYYYDFKPYAEVILGTELPRRLSSSVCIGFGKDWKPLLLGSVYGGIPFKVDEEIREESFPNEILGIKALTTQPYETRYKKCLDCGLGNWHEATTCERCEGILERV